MDKIEIKYDTSKYMKKDFLNFVVNGETINQLIDHYYPNLTHGLVPPFLNLMSDREEDLVWKIFESDSSDVVSLPILICSDDLDLTCTVIAVEVQKNKNSVKWLRFGHADEEGMLYEDSILDKIPSFEFDNYAYTDVIRAFKWKRDTKISQKILFSVVLNSLFAYGDVKIYESYSKYDEELVIFTNKKDLETYLLKAIENKESHLMFKLYYKEMGGEVNIRKYSLNPLACEGHTFRYESMALGTIGFSLDCSKGENEIICNLYVQNQNYFAPNIGDDKLSEWNWESRDAIYSSLMADLTYVKERYRAENLMVKNINQELEELILGHGYDVETIGNKIKPNFEVPIYFETWFYPRLEGEGLQSRLDVGVTLPNGLELYEAFSDFGKSERDVINNNLTNFARGTLHVMLDAFNATKKYSDKETWTIQGQKWNVFIGDYNIKKASAIKSVEIPPNLFELIEEILYEQELTEEYYFIRCFYAHYKQSVMASEFMINNKNIEYAEEKIAKLDWMSSENFYSVREFLILKKSQF